MQRRRVIGNRYWIGVVFFLLAAAPGFWFPVLSNVIRAKGWGAGVVEWAFLLPPLASIFSPLVFAAKADRSYPAEKVLACIMIGGASLLFTAFWFLEHGDSPALFLVFMGLNALVSAPAWSLLMAVALGNLNDPERQFGAFRVWGTLGWIAAGWAVSLLQLDQSAATGMIASGVRILAGLACLCLPHTPPNAEKATNWRAALGLDALDVLKQRDLAVYFLTAFLFSVPLAAFYMYTPRHLEDLGMTSVAAGMTWGQASEVVALLGLGYVMVRWRLKTLLLVALGCGVARYALYALAGNTGSVGLILVGVVLHGLCWTFFFESGRVFVDRRVEVGRRSRTQALLSLVSGGIGGVIGTKCVGWLYRRMVEDQGPEAWTNYWWVLTAMCLAAGLIFLFGYRGLPAGHASAARETPATTGTA